MQGQQFFHSLELDDDAIFNQEVDSIPGFELNAVVSDRQADLVLKLQSGYGKLVVKAGLICALQQTCAENGMNLVRRIWNLTCYRFVHERGFHLRVLRVRCGGELRKRRTDADAYRCPQLGTALVR
jgi:hypothetical protein